MVSLPLCIAFSASAQTAMDTIWVCATYDAQSSLTTVKKYVLKGKELYDLSFAEFLLRTGAAVPDKGRSDISNEPKYQVIKDEQDGLIAVHAEVGDDEQKRHQLWIDVIMIYKNTGDFRDVSLSQIGYGGDHPTTDHLARGACTVVEGIGQPTKLH